MLLGSSLSGGGLTENERSLWSLQPTRHSSLPKVRDQGWSRTGMDLFVLAECEKRGLTPTTDADRRTLIRRAYFDLTGLPPSPADVESFHNDDSPDAFNRVVEKLLASRAYGERWGRHWLDVARYADTAGDTGDYPISQAYLYRNWVIDAFNKDLPYDQFIRQQIAGDILARDETDPETYRDSVVATGFVALSRRFGNKKDDLHLTIEDTIDTIGRGILGLTLKCARCHHHKTDSIQLADYYGLYGIFASTRYPWAGTGFHSVPTDLQPLSPDPGMRQKISGDWQQLASYVRQSRDHWQVGKQAQEYKELTRRIEEETHARQDVSHLVEERERLLRKTEEFRDFLVHGLDWLREQVDTLLNKFPETPVAFAVSEGEPRDARIHLGGDPGALGERVPRGFLEVISRDSSPKIDGGSGRLELATWLTTSDHPLTARVIVNRVWQWHFGRGLVGTPDNFGQLGDRPSHPELLDYLARTFVADGWSLKRLHRRILLSRVYQLSTRHISENADKDPENIYLWRFPKQRMDAEVLRDAMLAVSGELDRSPGGPHPFRPWHEIRYGLNTPFQAVFETKRRSVYVMTQRLFKNPFFARFGGPDRNETTSLRDRTDLPDQALYLMNSPFLSRRATAFARRIIAAESTDRRRIVYAFALAFGRPPREEEIDDSLQFLESYELIQSSTDIEATSSLPDAWSGLAQVLLMSNEFFFIN